MTLDITKRYSARMSLVTSAQFKVNNNAAGNHFQNVLSDDTTYVVTATQMSDGTMKVASTTNGACFSKFCLEPKHSTPYQETLTRLIFELEHTGSGTAIIGFADNTKDNNSFDTNFACKLCLNATPRLRIQEKATNTHQLIAIEVPGSITAHYTSAVLTNFDHTDKNVYEFMILSTYDGTTYAFRVGLRINGQLVDESDIVKDADLDLSSICVIIGGDGTDEILISSIRLLKQ